MAAHIPDNPSPLAPTSYKISPHHFPPFRTRQEYREWKKTGKRVW